MDNKKSPEKWRQSILVIIQASSGVLLVKTIIQFLTLIITFLSQDYQGCAWCHCFGNIFSPTQSKGMHLRKCFSYPTALHWFRQPLKNLLLTRWRWAEDTHLKWDFLTDGPCSENWQAQSLSHGYGTIQCATAINFSVLLTCSCFTYDQ